MDTNPGEDDKGHDDEWLQTWEQIARLLGQLTACGLCRGDGMCPRCNGNGLHFVRGQGMVACPNCIGDGACVVCRGTGKLHHA